MNKKKYHNEEHPKRIYSRMLYLLSSVVFGLYLSERKIYEVLVMTVKEVSQKSIVSLRNTHYQQPLIGLLPVAVKSVFIAGVPE